MSLSWRLTKTLSGLTSGTGISHMQHSLIQRSSIPVWTNPSSRRVCSASSTHRDMYLSSLLLKVLAIDAARRPPCKYLRAMVTGADISSISSINDRRYGVRC